MRNVLFKKKIDLIVLWHVLKSANFAKKGILFKVWITAAQFITINKSCVTVCMVKKCGQS